MTEAALDFSEEDIQKMLDNIDSFSPDEVVEIDRIVDELASRKQNELAYNDLIEFCDNQESNAKAFTSIKENKPLIQSNYNLMQLYSPSLSAQTKQSIEWIIDNFEHTFNKTQTYKMMLEDGINEISWITMFESFARIQRDKKELNK